jgi:pimeloyl-ACP methyl ester carboxylesterase
MGGLWKVAVLGAALWAGAAQAQTTAPADYGVAANWLCRPGRADACAQDEAATIIAADGGMTREAFTPAADAPIDCFYVYPTVSLDPGPNSDLTPGREERFVVQGQFARFAARCRTYAPLYRQVTLTALHTRMSGGSGPQPDRLLAYNDVLASWRHYLAHDNQGRGVVLIGHSQGSAVLMQLIKEEIDGKPVQARLVSAILLGANVVVPDGQDVGGTFKHIPACHAADQTGCVISYVSFRDTAPPPAGGAFGRAMEPLSPQVFANSHALCTNPASLAGGAGPLHSYFPADFGAWATKGFSWTRTQQKIDTPFVTTPGLLSAQCVTDGPSTYLAIHINAGADDGRAQDIPGDVVVNGRLFPDWGLHRIDMHEAIGDLVDIVGRQGAAYAAAHPGR